MIAPFGFFAFLFHWISERWTFKNLFFVFIPYALFPQRWCVSNRWYKYIIYKKQFAVSTWRKSKSTRSFPIPASVTAAHLMFLLKDQCGKTLTTTVGTWPPPHVRSSSLTEAEVLQTSVKHVKYQQWKELRFYISTAPTSDAYLEGSRQTWRAGMSGHRFVLCAVKPPFLDLCHFSNHSGNSNSLSPL